MTENSPFPPWSASPDETPISEPKGFELCDQVLQTLASTGKGKILEKSYWTSLDWGNILRAKVSVEGSQADHLVNCWYVSESETAIATKVDDDNNWESPAPSD